MSDLEGREVAAIDLYDGAYGPSILLVLASQDSIAWLRTIFENIAAAPVGAVVNLARLPRVRTTRELSGLVLSKAAYGSKRHLVREGAGRFVWSCTSDEWRTKSLMLEPFLRQSGHQYLTAEGADDALVEVSYGEDHGKRGRRDVTRASPDRD